VKSQYAETKAFLKDVTALLRKHYPDLNARARAAKMTILEYSIYAATYALGGYVKAEKFRRMVARDKAQRAKSRKPRA
jgi:hypothetical protein